MAIESTAANDPTRSSDDLAKLVLRVLLGVLLLLHGIAKLKGGVGFIVDLVTKAGLPAAFAYLVYIGEVLAPILVIIGLFTRAAAIVIAINILFAIGLTQPGQIFALNKFGAWAIELEGFYLFVAIAVALLGAGRYSVGGLAGRWN